MSIRKTVVNNDVEGLNKILSTHEVVDISCYNNICIKWAISNGYSEIVRLLLAYGLTKPLTRDEIYHNLNIAIMHKYQETIDIVTNYYSIDMTNVNHGLLF